MEPEDYNDIPQLGIQMKFFEAWHVDVVIGGAGAGVGKSWALLMEAARPVMYHIAGKWIIRKPYSATIFRRTYPEIDNPGGLWDESMLIYPNFRGIPTQSDKEWKFIDRVTRKEFAKIVFRHIQREEDKTNYQGAQLP